MEIEVEINERGSFLRVVARANDRDATHAVDRLLRVLNYCDEVGLIEFFPRESDTA